ncbi:MAG: glycosyl hydrolase family 8 [candidate division WOR-3 bacterium]|jgi:endo-1,4-beta-D-glucanase Y
MSLAAKIKFFIKNIAIIIMLFFSSGRNIFGQSRPFPQNADYPYGYATSVISAVDLQVTYERWKKMYLKSCDGMYRVCVGDTLVTISEGIGYGMLITAYYGDKERFDRLFEFYKTKRTEKAYGLMGWRVTCDSIIDPGSATDGDIDVAFALIVAHSQWGGEYLEEAKNIISILKEHYFVNCNGVYTMKPGGHWGGCDLTDISYYAPAYFRVFADVMKDPFWDTVADHSYTILHNGVNKSTGLVPDWQSYDGVPGGDPHSGRADYYLYDASRTPWRFALDYLWNGNKKAKNWCVKISDFADSIGAANIVDGYDLDGTPRGQYNNGSFVGGFAVGAMCNSRSIVDNFALRLIYLDNAGEDNQYFNLSLRCLYELVLTGNFWKPDAGDHKVD